MSNPTKKQLEEIGLTLNQYKILIEENKKALNQAEKEATSSDSLYALSSKYLRRAARIARKSPK